MILFYTDELNPRIEYIAQLIFSQILKTEILFTTKSSEFSKSHLPKINYSYEKFEDEFYIKPHRFLYCKALIQPNIEPVWYNGEKVFFESSKDSVIPFDPLAASFYLVTRYEEYLEKERDKYNRYPAEKSILTKYNLLKKPVVNIWARLLAEKLKEKFPELEFPRPKFEFLPSIDIDNAWAFSNKGFWRGFGALAKDISKGRFLNAKNRFNVWRGNEKDPYDTYNYLDTILTDHKKKVFFFFLVGDYKRYDKSISSKNKKFKNLIRETARKYETGIHPSYSSSKKKGKNKLVTEIQRMEKITGGKMTKSRQHYLRLKFPRNYRRLLKAGIKEDYTMGYSSHTGFRAGICTPYFFYDLKKETITSLKINPFQVMDVTLRSYMGLTPEEAFREIENLIHEVKRVGGTFSVVWHNETLNEQNGWEGYRKVFEHMINTGFNQANE